MLSRRSLGDRHMEAIRRRAAAADVFILGGDIFDFRWATMATLDEAVHGATTWLRNLVTHAPHCQFHYLLGNHDYHGAFLAELACLEAGVPSLSTHPFHLRLGNSLFMHGDVAVRKMTSRKLAASRSRWLHARKRGRLLGGVYDLAILANLHRPFPFLRYPKRAVAKRILVYLEDIGHGPRDGVRHVYFGHTHRALAGYQYGGVIFHNGGAALRGVPFHILEVAAGAERH